MQIYKRELHFLDNLMIKPKKIAKIIMPRNSKNKKTKKYSDFYILTCISRKKKHTIFNGKACILKSNKHKSG